MRSLRLATPADIPTLIALERLTESQLYVGQWSEERHRATLAGEDARYYVVDAADGSLAAYAILRGLAENSGSIELKRVVVGEPGNGLGRRILTELLRIAAHESNLTAQASGLAPRALIAFAPDRFADPQGACEIHFLRNDKHEVTSLKIVLAGAERRAERVGWRTPSLR